MGYMGEVHWSNQSQFHFWPLEWITVCRCVESVPKDTITVDSSTEILAIEVRVVTVIMPPRSLIVFSTVNTVPVVVSVMSGELHTIMITQAVPSRCRSACYVTTNFQPIVGGRISNRKIPVLSILVTTFKVTKVNPQLWHRSSSRQTVNLLQSQPMLSLHISKPIFILRPPSVEVH